MPIDGALPVDDVIKELLVESPGLDQLDLDRMSWKTHSMIAIALVVSADLFIR